VRLTRQQPGAAGHIHWNMNALMKNRGRVADDLARASYGSVAVPPALPERATVAKPALSARAIGEGTRFAWSSANDSTIRFWVAQTKTAGRWRTDVLPRATTSLTQKTAPEAFTLRALDRFGNLSAPTTVERRYAPK
jgi:hypothetical protein